MKQALSRSIGRVALRFACALGMALWLGGFTFYSAFVVPTLRDELGGLGSGLVTQRVTNDLNLMGAIALVPWWIEAWIGRAGAPRWRGRLQWTLLATTTAGLVWLAVLHRSLDRLLESDQMASFHPMHELYLIVSTVMWVANIGLVAIASVPECPPARSAG